MKLKNFFAMAALALVAVSCSDDDDEVAVNHSLEIAGSYEGKMVQVVMGEKAESDQTVTLKSQNDGRLTIVFPASGEGTMATPEILLKDLNLVEGANGEFVFSIAEKDTVVVFNEELKKKYLYTNMNGTVKDQKFNLTYKAKMGRMPFWMDATFNGTKK